MLFGEFALWLLKAAGGQAIKGQFARRGMQAQVRSLQKALVDSQNERDELAVGAELVARVSAERDVFQAEAIRLRAENVALRAEVERLRAVGWPD